MAAVTPNIQDLPPELLLEIFSHISANDLILGVGKVSKKFREMSSDPQLWRHIQISCLEQEADISGFSVSAEDFYRKMVNYMCTKETSFTLEKLPVKNVTTVVEERGPVWPNLSVTRDVVYPKLQQLVLVRDALPSMHFLQHYKGLTHLHVEGKFEENTAGLFFHGQIVLDILENVNAMKELHILKVILPQCFSFRVHDGLFIAIQMSMVDYFVSDPRLREIDISLDMVNDEVFRTIMDHCSELEDLTLRCLKFTVGEFTAVLAKKQWPLLTSLRITDCEVLDDACLRALAVAFPNLKCLKLSLTKTMTDDGMGKLLRECCQLRSLNLSTLFNTSAGIGKLTGCCLKELAYHGNLYSLYLHNFDLTCERDGWDFEKLCQRQQNLHTIELSVCEVKTCTILAMADHCPLLQTVKMISCRGLTSGQQAVLLARLPHLQTLYWDDARSLSENGSEMFSWEDVQERRPSGEGMLLNQPTEQHSSSLHKPSLDSLTLNCRKERMAGRKLVFPSFFSLLHLDMHTGRLCDDTVAHILGMCPKLQDLSLRLSPCGMRQRETKLTEASLTYIQELGRCLRTVQLLTFRSFTSAALARTLVDLPQLRQCAVLCPDQTSTKNMDQTIVRDLSMALKERGDDVSLCFSVGIRMYKFLPDFSGRLRRLDILIHSRMD
ncbi:hypothetical protein ACOMHN_056387 [Nucella lapillus]